MKVTWKAPSNIALIKYWGKIGHQIPGNPSLSFTLNKACTETSVNYSPSESFFLDFSFEGRENNLFKDRIEKYMRSLFHEYPFLSSGHFEISSKNSFPHSAGLASSASSFASLGLCLADLAACFEDSPKENFFQKASSLARLGSGSSCRSIFPGIVSWGEHTTEYAQEWKEADKIFHDYHNAILIVSKEKKEISSGVGHKLFGRSLYAPIRYKNAKNRYFELKNIMKSGDLSGFQKLVEQEYLDLHAHIMLEGHCLLNGRGLDVINKIKKYRTSSRPWTITLDAGPNIHLLYPKNEQPHVEEFIEAELKNDLKECIFDSVGKGPQKL